MAIPIALPGWRVRPAGALHDGRMVTFERLSEGIARGEAGDLDEVRGPGESSWQKIGEHPKLSVYLPRPRVLRSREYEEETDMTPMIDVTFQLLIFFMISATYVVQKSLDWPHSKPDANAAAVQSLEELDKSHVLVRISGEGTVTVDGRSADVDEYADAIGQAIRSTGSAEVLLEVDDEAQHDVVVQVLDAAASAQAQQILYVSHSTGRVSDSTK